MISTTYQHYIKGFNPIVNFPDCGVVKRTIYDGYISTKVPINRKLLKLEDQRTPMIADITPIWFLRNKSKLSAMIDLESNGTEITEVGIIIYNKYRIVWIYHQIFNTRTMTLPGLERFVHEAADTPTDYFVDVRADIVSVLRFCDCIVVKGCQLEASIFPELANRMIDLNMITSFPRIDEVDSNKILTAYNIMKPYLMLTKKQSEDVVDINELRHNPLLECYIFWFIMNNINPKLLYTIRYTIHELFGYNYLHILN